MTDKISKLSKLPVRILIIEDPLYSLREDKFYVLNNHLRHTYSKNLRILTKYFNFFIIAPSGKKVYAYGFGYLRVYRESVISMFYYWVGRLGLNPRKYEQVFNKLPKGFLLQTDNNLFSFSVLVRQWNCESLPFALFSLLFLS